VVLLLVLSVSCGGVGVLLFRLGLYVWCLLCRVNLICVGYYCRLLGCVGALHPDDWCVVFGGTVVVVVCGVVVTFMLCCSLC